MCIYIYMCYLPARMGQGATWSHSCDGPSDALMMMMSCDIHTHTPARKTHTNSQLYYFVIQIGSANWLGPGHGYECHSSDESPLWPAPPPSRGADLVKRGGSSLQCSVASRRVGSVCSRKRSIDPL